MNQKTSKLQKKILTTIYKQGAHENVIGIVELNPKKVDVQYQRAKQKLVDERNGIFFRDGKDTDGLLTRYFKVKAFSLRRSKLASILYDWGKYNIYLERLNDVRFKIKPNNYYKREVALTNSLKSLETKGYVDFLDTWGNKISVSNRKKAKIVDLTTTGILKTEKILSIKF